MLQDPTGACCIWQAFSAPHEVAKLMAELGAGGLVEAAVPARSGGPPPQHARFSAPGSAAVPSQPPAQMVGFVRPPSPFATVSYAPPPPPLSAAMPAAGGQQPEQPRSRSAMALAAEVVAANAVLADRARAKQAYATTDKAQVGAPLALVLSDLDSQVGGTGSIRHAGKRLLNSFSVTW